METPDFSDLKVVALAGGVGGAKLVRGLNLLLPPEQFCVIVNTGDDFEHLGLAISPDLDSVMYALAGLNDPVRGWGLLGESWQANKALATYGIPNWFQLGDRDLGTHIARSHYKRQGFSLTEITEKLRQGLGVHCRILPMSNDPAPTRVQCKNGRVLAFQEYFVREACRPEVEKIILPPDGTVTASREALEAIQEAGLVVLAPSNPWLSIDPILNVSGVKNALKEKAVVAVSPFIGGKAIKGPAAKIAAELGWGTTPKDLVAHYQGLLRGLLFDLNDPCLPASYGHQGIISRQADILMKGDEDKKRVAADALTLGLEIIANHLA